MISEFSQMIHCMVLESPISARELAKSVGKPYSTLLREINPYDSGAKLGVETYFQLLERTGDLSSLEYMLHRLGLGLAPLDTPLAAAWRRRPDRVAACLADTSAGDPLAPGDEREERLRA